MLPFFNYFKILDSSDTKSVYGGVEGQHASPEHEKIKEKEKNANTKNDNYKKTEKNSDFYLYQIKSTILM